MPYYLYKYTGMLVENSKEFDKIFGLVNMMKPDSITLSSVENKSIVEKTIEEIASVSDIMIARGDLVQNICKKEFYNIEKRIASIVKEKEHKLYVATGIMSSLADNSIPTVSEIVDIATIMELDTYTIVLNFGVVRGQSFANAIEICKSMINTEEKYV